MRALLIAASLALGACATVAAPETPGQRLYAAYGAYGVALAGAADYRESPTADPGVVAALQKANREAQPAVAFGRAYVACKGSNATVAAGVDCALWNFQPSSVASMAVALRAAVVALTMRVR